ncbi:MAG: response regulator, partial [Treponema sp.]|nr:response regulator [Treponema sp.]
ITAGAKVLVVDDSPLYLENISRTISTMTNLTVATASSGTMALQMIREAAKQHQEFSLVLMDMGMPSMDGWRLAAEINKDPAINGAKLYLMIPEGQLGGEAKMKLLSWFNGYLYKPVQRKKLLDLLVHAFTQPLELPTVEQAEAEELAQITARSKTPSFQKLVREKIAPTAQEPAQGSQAQVASAAILPEQDFPSPIIAVDDHPVNLKILTTFLSSFGVEAHGATSGEKAIALAQQYPDTKIIFMDIEMPFMNGFETSAKLRENGYKGIIVACSANSTPDIIQEYIKAGINDYFAKPFKKQQLADILAKWQKLPQSGTDGLWQGPQ